MVIVSKNKTKKAFFGLSHEVAERTLTLIVSAFGLVAALAWNEAIRTAINSLFRASGTIISLFIYAVTVTVLAVFITTRLAKIIERVKKHEESESKEK